MRRRRRSAVSPWNVDPLRSATLRGIRSARSGLGQRSFRSSALNRKSCHASCLGDVGEARWLLSHRWIDSSPILPNAAHDSRNQGRVVSLSALSLLSAYVGLRQPREVQNNSLQQALNPCSRTQSAATDGSPACCTSPMLCLCVMLRASSQSSVRSLLVLLLCKPQCLSCFLFGPVRGTIGPCRGVLPRTNARCVVGQ